MNKQTMEMIKLASRYLNAVDLNEREGNQTSYTACNGAFWGVVRCIGITLGISDMDVYDLVLDYEDGILAA